MYSPGKQIFIPDRVEQALAAKETLGSGLDLTQHSCQLGPYFTRGDPAPHA